MAHDPLTLLADLIARARAAGADAADALLLSGTSLSVQRRAGAVEHIERSEGRDLGLRVFVGQKSAIVSSTTVDPAAFAEMAARAVAMAKVVPDDPFAGLADTAAPPRDARALDLDDGQEPAAASLAEQAAVAEDAARSVAGVTNSEGAEAGFGRSEAALVTSAGFAATLTRSAHTVAATALAGTGTAMQRDYEYHRTIHRADLEDPALIGRRAGERAVARLNPVRARTARLPVIYDRRVAAGLLGHLAGAINGASVARGSSFLKDRMGQRIFAAGITVTDDPHRVRGLRSLPYDSEGTPTARRNVIEDGVLTTWFLDSRAARQLGLASTGHAARGTGGPPSPSPSNLFLAPGSLSPAALMADIKEGLYVTELIGMGVNGVTGDYSRGAAGFMIRDGQLAEPVAEITIAGNLIEMFAHLTPADDLVFRHGTDAPTLRVDGLTLAGA
ncbi:MAG: TldD/PmbA family protein [Rhodospirillales bacterium]|nr:TldD/PmbA family protein [Rhodospirillales bacterium]